MLEIEIDGKKLTVAEGSMIIEAADNAGIYIPRYCYHKKLSIAANCRMCLVEVEKVGKPLPACATPVTAGMKVFTQSQKALQAQRAVMEFLLINHPLDCPVCDQGGECELQDLSMGFGKGFSRYNEPKRSVASENIGPLIETWMTRCIQCTRCVRFGDEIAGLREMGATGRGENLEIGTYVKHFLKSEISANIIDICPVGALTNKPSRYAGRGWEYQEHPMIASHDCVGSNLFVHTRGFEFKAERQVMRAVPRENESINENWISDRDRFFVHALHHETRVHKPRMKKNGVWVDVDWQRALLEIADRWHAIAQNQSPEQIAAIASPSSTIEELYLLQKMMRAMGSNNIDHRYREQDFADQSSLPLQPIFETKLADLENQNLIILLGTNLRYEAPMMFHRVRKGASEQTKVLAINPKDYTYTLTLDKNWRVSPAKLVDALAQLVKAAAEIKQQSCDLNLAISDSARAMAKQLCEAASATLIFGELVNTHPQASTLRALLHELKKLTGVKLNNVSMGANSAGAWLAGAVPHRGPAGASVTPGKNCKALLTEAPVRAYLLLNVEPEQDFIYSQAALNALDKAGLVVAITPFSNSETEKYADFILPLAPFTESGGTFVNAQNNWQSFAPVSLPHGESKPGWKILRALAGFLKLENFNYETVHEVQFEIKKLTEAQQAEFSYKFKAEITPPALGLMRLAPWLIYRADSLVRRSEPLQASMVNYTVLAINASTAHKLQLNSGDQVSVSQNGQSIEAQLTIDERLADDTVWLPSGIIETAGFGWGFERIELNKL